MSKKNKIHFCLFFLLFSLKAMAFDCKTYNTRYIYNKVSVPNKEKICLQINEGYTAASSEKCQFLTSKACPFSKIKKGPQYNSFVSEMGSPGFNICHHLEGSPQLYEIEVAGKWAPFARCYWKNSKEFVEITELTHFYRMLNQSM